MSSLHHITVNDGGMTDHYCVQVCTHLERLTSELEAAAHPALDALTNKVQAGHSYPECISTNCIFACVVYTVVIVPHTLLVCVICIAFTVTDALFAAKLWYEYIAARD